MFFVDWWNSMSAAAQVFSCIAIPATLVLVVQTVLMFLGIGEDGGADTLDGLEGVELPLDAGLPEAGDGVFGEGIGEGTPTDIEGLDGLRILSVRGVIAFLVVFGWVGVVMQAAEIRLLYTLPVAFVCGAATMVGLAFLFRAVIRLRSDGNIDNRNAIGTSGRVHLTVPACRSGEGKVHLMLQGVFVERDAVTDESEPIPTGTEVVVVGISGQTDLVVRRK